MLLLLIFLMIQFYGIVIIKIIRTASEVKAGNSSGIKVKLNSPKYSYTILDAPLSKYNETAESLRELGAG